MTTKTITIKKPFDSHVHLRRGATLRAVTKYTAERFGRGIIMPNTEPPIDTVEQALEYKKEILSAIPVSLTNQVSQTNRNAFEPLMTLYLTKNLKASEIEKAASGGTKIYGVKYYPWGYSINSQWGPRNVVDAKEVLQAMEGVGIPLLLHSEVHLNDKNEEEDPYEGEKIFFNDVLPKLLETYPKLKISLEHISTREAAIFIEKNGQAEKLVATITPHHLVYDRTHAFSGGYRTLLSCKPLIKMHEDREALRELLKKDLPFISAGTDSAPHPESRKFSSCAVYGAFNAPVAVELYTQVFDELGCLDPLDKLGASKLEGFLSVNGPRFFGLEPSAETITLAKEDWQVTEPVVTDEGVKIWSLCDKQHGLGNEVIHWKLNAD
ncbi:MAG: dihydroorotase [bacterium]|nr:dihydroorotase [bacterium]